MSDRRKPFLFTVSAGLLDVKHCRAIGPALWTYLAIIDRQTHPTSGVVNRGEPISAARLGSRMGLSQDAVLRHLERLEGGGYVELKRAQHGLIITVAKPKKLFKRVGKNADSRVGKNTDSDRGQSPQSCGSESAFLPGLYKESIASKAIPASSKRGSPKTVLDPDRCSHDPRCKTVPGHIAVIIAESADIEPVFSPKELGQAKALANVSDNEIRGTVDYMLAEHGDFWGRKARITPSAVRDNLPLFRKQARGRVNGHAVDTDGPQGGFWVSDREKDRRREAGEGGHAA